MKLKKSYTLLYLPEDYGPTRQIKISRWAVVSCCVVVLFLGALSSLYFLGVRTGSGWLPGGSRLQRENRALVGQIEVMEADVGSLRAEVENVFQIQNQVALAVNLPAVDEETFAAGVGGRGSFEFGDAEVPGLESVLEGEGGFAELGQELQRMVRQARIQRQGYQAMLDTLDARELVRDRIPSIRPVDVGWVSSRFGLRKDPFTNQQAFHRGLDFSVRLGTPVRVTGDGVVVAVQQQRGLGRVVKVDHGDGVMTVYAHLDKALVKKGTQVQRGQIIAKSGNSGRSTAPHLHYEIRIGGRAVNPISYILDSYASRS
ncbi:MAG: M23 family metallopeptidase [Gemmatimonadales bacterium]|nr:M23 family metallopeptidase [Gemmatimonadales bacterium]